MKRHSLARFIAIASAFLVAICLLLADRSPAFAMDEPLATDPYAQAVTVALDDRSYLVDVSLEGGTGRASVTSPAQVTVMDGKAVASIEWSSPHYDYMLVAGKCYLPVNEEGNSVFEIPVLAFDEPFTVVADTTAMSQPHEIEYQLTFDAESATVVSTEKTNGSLPVLVFAATGLAVAAGVIVARRKR